MVLSAAIAVSACGDKLLHLNRIHRMRAAAVSGSVVVFARPNSLLGNAANFHLERAFKDEGLGLRLVSTDRELAELIQSGKADVVIVDIADKDVVQRMASPTSLLVVPVVAKGDAKGEADAKHFSAVIKSPAKSGKFVDAVDRAVDAQWAQQEARPRSR
jgi:DNA-binding NtrC family response regulator